MWFPDVNVLIYAFFPQLDLHQESIRWLEETLSGTQSVLCCDITELGFLRVSSQISNSTHSFEEIWKFLDYIRKTPAYRHITSGQKHRDEFYKLAHSTPAKGKHFTDFWLAALAIENKATIVSYDRDFKKIPNLKTIQPS